jgi:hypothetical protein
MGLQQLGNSSLIKPAFAAWAPLLIFIPVAVAMTHSMWE